MLEFLALENASLRLAQLHSSAKDIPYFNYIENKIKESRSIERKKNKKKIGSFSLIERVILSAGAMLIFSVSFQIDQMPEGKNYLLNLNIIVKYTKWPKTWL